MKNIHLIETDKPSRLYKSKITQNLFISDVLSFSCDGTYNQHLYITSDEVIKGDAWRTDGKEVLRTFKGAWGKWFKIILTTDQDLINNGVQAIDDEFIDWFVNNPTCEEVKVADYGNILFDDKVFHMYKIVIPKKEEPNPFELPEVLPDDVFYESLDDSCIKELGHSVQVEDDLTDDEWLIKEKHKETLDFGEWLLASEIRYVDNTMEGNIYIVFGYADYYGVRLTIKDLHEIYLKQK